MHLGETQENFNFTFTLQTARYTLHAVRTNLIANSSENMHPNRKNRQTQTSYGWIWLITYSRNQCTNQMGPTLESLVASNFSVGMISSTHHINFT